MLLVVVRWQKALTNEPNHARLADFEELGNLRGRHQVGRPGLVPLEREPFDLVADQGVVCVPGWSSEDTAPDEPGDAGLADAEDPCGIGPGDAEDGVPVAG
jgi:hypothetical protein